MRCAVAALVEPHFQITPRATVPNIFFVNRRLPKKCSLSEEDGVIGLLFVPKASADTNPRTITG